MAKISVIVPVYNVEKYLHRCVDSILAQTFTDFELILVDDGSPDNCGAICDEYALKDNRVKVIHQQNGGLSAARNAGLDWAFECSDSEWLTFIDSDDKVYPQYLHRLFITAIENQADVSVCGMGSFDVDFSMPPETNFDDEKVYNTREACLLIYSSEKGHSVYVSACMKLYRKDLFGNIRFMSGKLHEDQFTTYKVLYKAKKVVEIGDKLYCYYINEASITNSQFKIKRYDNVVACTEALDFFAEKQEPIIVSAIEKRIKLIIAQFAIISRKAGVYRDVPKEYRMSIATAIKTIKDFYDVNYCEYFIARYYPKAVSIYSYIKKVIKIFSKKLNFAKRV